MHCGPLKNDENMDMKNTWSLYVVLVAVSIHQQLTGGSESVAQQVNMIFLCTGFLNVSFMTTINVFFLLAWIFSLYRKQTAFQFV